MKPSLLSAATGLMAGALTEILKALPGLDPETRRTVGAAANALKRELERAIEARQAELKRSAASLSGVDLTMPGRRQWQGGVHIVTQIVDEICDIMAAYDPRRGAARTPDLARVAEAHASAAPPASEEPAHQVFTVPSPLRCPPPVSPPEGKVSPVHFEPL